MATQQTELKSTANKVRSRLRTIKKNNKEALFSNYIQGLNKDLRHYDLTVESKSLAPKGLSSSQEETLTKVYKDFLFNTDSRKAKFKTTTKYTLNQLVNMGLSGEYFNYAGSELEYKLSRLGSYTKRQLQHLKKANVLESSPAARYLLDELEKFGIYDWEERGALSMKDATHSQKRHFYKTFSEFFEHKTSSIKGAKDFKRDVEYTTGADKYAFSNEDEKKQYMANFWYMFHNANEEMKGEINAMQGYVDGQFTLKTDSDGNKITVSVQELIGRGDVFYLNEEDVKKAEILQQLIDSDSEEVTEADKKAALQELNSLGTTLKDLLLSFDSRGKGFTSSRVPKEVKGAFNLAIRMEYDKRFK